MSNFEDSLKKITKGAGIAFVGIIVSKLLGYIYRILVARTDTETYGLLSIGIALFSLLSTVSLLGLNNGILRYVAFYNGKEDQEKIKQVIKICLKITIPFSIVICILFFIFSEQISLYFFHTSDLTIVFKIIAFTIPIVVFRDIIFSIFQALQKIKYEIYSKNLTENITKIILTLIFLSLGFKLVGFTLAYVLGTLVGTIIALYFLKRRVLPSLETAITDGSSDSALKRELLSYSIPLLFNFVIYSLITWIDTLMLGYFRTPYEVGIYNAALPTAFLMYMIPSTLLILFIPVLSELYAKDEKNLFELLHRRITKWILSANLILLGVFYLFSEQILKILFGNDYIVGSTALLILSTGYFVGYSLAPSTKLLVVIKRTKLVFANTIVVTVVNVILNLFLIPLYGINGAAIATAMAFFARFILLFIQSYIVIRIAPFKLNHLKILFSAICSFLILKYLISYFSINLSILPIIFLSALFVLLYLILLILTKSFEKEDIFIIKKIKEKLINVW